MRAAIRCCSPRPTGLADRLLPSFNASPLGIPHRFINLRTGRRARQAKPIRRRPALSSRSSASSAAPPATTAIAPPPSGRSVAHVRASLEDRPARRRDRLHDRRVDRAAARPSGRRRDSYYEYLWDGWDLLGDRDCLAMYRTAAPRAILKHQAQRVDGRLVVRRRRFRNRQAHQLAAGRACILLRRPARPGRSARVRRRLHAQLGRGSAALRRAARKRSTPRP